MMMTGKPITLTELLRARDLRHDRQVALLGRFSDMTLLQITVVMPGSCKRNRASAIIADAALDAVTNAFEGHIKHVETNDADTGYEAYVVLDMPRREAKLTAIDIEEQHPLGRLMDIDIILPQAMPMSRSEAGAPARRCLMCQQEARLCMRERAHSPQEIESQILKMVNDYVAGI